MYLWKIRMEVEIQNKIKIKIDSKVYEFEYIQDLIPMCQNGKLRVYNHLNSAYNGYEKMNMEKMIFVIFGLNILKASQVYIYGL